MERRRCELLAPAGSIEAYIAAVESGADAIYVGGTLFNARMNAKNLSDGDLEEAIAFAHKRRVKTYVTVNTLIRDEELGTALDYCGRLTAMGADGLIIQDLGLGSLVRRHIPEMPIHLSTQGTVYDLRGVRAAEKLGYSRVVTARELSLEEIREICRNTDTEIEVFCHGALCFCYSGQCQLSRYIGGRSANRGECAQPCRMEYRRAGAKAAEFLLSPADSCMLEHIDDLAAAGVASLKIEGRMKSPEYVSEVVSIYRKRLDEYYRALETGDLPAAHPDTEQDLARLTQVFSRGFTDGFFSGEEDRSYMSGTTSKNRGVQIGKIPGSKPSAPAGGRGRAAHAGSGGSTVEMELFGELEKGDGIEIRRSRGNGAETAIASCHVTFIKKEGKDRFLVGDVKNREGMGLLPGDRIYKMSRKEQLDGAALSYRNKDWHSGRYARKIPVEIEVSSPAGNPAMLHVHSSDPVMDWTFGPFETSGSDISGRAASAFSKTGGTPFDLSGLRVQEGMMLAVPMSALNDMRRRVFADLEEELAGQAVRQDPEKAEAIVISSGSEDGDRTGHGAGVEAVGRPERPCLEVFFYDMKDWDAWRAGAGEAARRLCSEAGVDVRMAVPLVQLAERGTAEAKDDVIPYVSSVTLGKEERFIGSHMDGIMRIVGETGVYAGSLSSAELFAGKAIKVSADFGMNVYNAETEDALFGLGVMPGIMSLETAERAAGAYPLMVTRHRLEEGRFTDRKGAKYMVLAPDWTDNRVIVPDAEPDWERCVEGALAAFGQGKRHRAYFVAGHKTAHKI